MGLTLSVPPGFSDLANSALASGQVAFGFNLAKIAENAEFGMVRPEIFVTGPHVNGDVVPIPKSPIDGYVYSRNELIYIWTIQNSVDKQTGWISGLDSLWFAAWRVDQSTGAVFSDEWYRRSGSHYDGTHSNDGTLTVFTIGQRQNANLVIASSPSYSAITGSWIAQDKPLTQQLAQGLNSDAKFACINKEVFYLGEYHNGQTVTMPHSPADGYAYSSAECKFMFSWRWTSPGGSHLSAPALSNGQLGPMIASVNSSGVVSTTIKYIDNSGNLNSFSDGQIAVFAFCQRSGTPGSISPAATNFAEISFDDFMPGQPVPFDTVIQQILNNILESLIVVEYFGPTAYTDGDTISVPTSPIDGYVYSRSELTYIWAFSDTTNASGSNLRMESFGGDINQTTGVVSLYGYRLPPGGPQNTPATVSFNHISVIVVARRNAAAQSTVGSGTTNLPGSSGVGGGQVVDVPTVSTLSGQSISGTGTSFTLTAATIVFLVWNGQVRFDFTQSSTTAFTTSFTVNTGDTLYAVCTT